MEKINFNDLPNTDTPINSSNLNQLQTNVEDALWVNITTGVEFETGRIIDGKKEYGKRFNAITLPSSANNKTIATGLGDINFIKLEGSISKDGGSESSNLPYMYTGQPDVYHYYSNNSKNITIRVTGDMSAYQVVETIYYTKN